MYIPPLPPMLHTVPAAPMPPFNPAAPLPHIVPSAPMQPFVPRNAPIRHDPGTSVYVRGLADDVGYDRLRDEFQTYGTIVDIKVIFQLIFFV